MTTYIILCAALLAVLIWRWRSREPKQLTDKQIEAWERREQP